MAFSGRDIGNIKKEFAEKDGLRNVYWCISGVFNRKINLIFETALFCTIFAVTSYF